MGGGGHDVGFEGTALTIARVVTHCQLVGGFAVVVPWDTA